MSEKITFELEFDFGTLEELGLTGFKQGFLEATRGDGDDMRAYSLTTGIGNTWLEASASQGDVHVYAQASARGMAEKLFHALDERLDAILVCPVCDAKMIINRSTYLPVCSNAECTHVGKSLKPPCDDCGKDWHEHGPGEKPAKLGHGYRHSFSSPSKSRKVRKVPGRMTEGDDGR